jgi:UDP-sulfoquinovose synthase
MKVLILGVEGYLGWPTAMYFAAKGHTVFGIDNSSKPILETECGVAPLVPIPELHKRFTAWKEASGERYLNHVITMDVRNPYLKDWIAKYQFDVVVHYAEQPSAPYSMMGRKQCVETQINNIAGTLNILWAIKDTDIHLIKLGTMGEYGTPNIDIEEGWLDVEHNGRRDKVLYPKQPGSWYHASKVCDSTNIEMACRLWGVRATDLNQGVVYGIDTDETRLDAGLATSFHYDHIFGTALNRFIVQAVAGVPLTVYGEGGQTRGWLNIKDTLRCVELALLNPPEAGEFRVFNQFTEQFSVQRLAEKVAWIAGCDIQNIPNPRKEKEQHYYNAKHTALSDLGLEPHLLTDDVIREMLDYVERHKDNIDQKQIMPTVTWR